MDRVKVTAIVTTFNEELCLDRCLKSVAWVDEILVVDSFSTDSTLQIIKKYSERVFQREYKNAADQKNWIIPQASHPWIVLLDADEFLTDELTSEIIHVLQNPKHDAYWIKRQNYFMDKRVRFSGWQGDRVIRLFKRDLCRYEAKSVHAEIQTTGSVGKLVSPMSHYPFRDVKHFTSKIDQYTTWAAQDRLPLSSKITYFHLFVKPAFRFVQFFVFRLGFLDGKHGYAIASFAAYSVYLRSVKLWELQRTKF